MENLGVPAEQPVFIGVWTNWSRGKVMGSTLTLSQRNGAFLVAFLALFVSFVGTSFFRVGSFILHINLSSPQRPRDTIYHQRQAVLRNSSNGGDSIWKLTQLSWYWGRTGIKATLKFTPFLVHSVVCISIFSIAGLFSSRIVALSGDDVLISGEHCCNSWPNDNTTATQFLQFEIPYMSQRVNSYINYAQDCYTSNSTSKRPRCQTFIKDRLPYSVNRAAPCPFNQSICKLPQKNIDLDTGLLDTHSDIGLNAPQSQRHKVRLAMRCAPLVSEPYKRTVYIPGLDSNDQNRSIPYTGYAYGPIVGKKKVVLEYTMYEQQNDVTRNLFDTNIFSMVPIPSGYSLSVMGYWPGSGSKLWSPIDALRRNESDDVYLLPLSGRNIRYSEVNDDPWFGAHRPLETLYQGSIGTVSSYVADETLSQVGCAFQIQLCFPPDKTSKGKTWCSPLGGMYQLQNFLDSEVSYNKNLTWWVNWALSIQDISLAAIIQSQGGSVLQAKYKISQFVQAKLPNNQWQIEMERLFTIMLAGIQASVVDTATGPADSGMRDYCQRPTSKEAKLICRNTKIRSTAYANFSVFGLSFTIAVGTIIILLNWTIEWTYKHWVRRYPSSRQFARLEWAVNGTLQLQRLAHESLGYGTWSHCDEEIPLTGDGEHLGTLDLDDLKHPRLALRGLGGNGGYQEKQPSLLTGDGASSQGQKTTPTQGIRSTDVNALSGSTPPMSPLSGTALGENSRENIHLFDESQTPAVTASSTGILGTNKTQRTPSADTGSADATAPNISSSVSKPYVYHDTSGALPDME